MSLHSLSAVDAARRIRDGEISAEELVGACLDHIAQRESTVGAWIFLDPDHALAQARRYDELQASGAELGPLHGVPVGIKDIVDTADQPTGCGSPLLEGRQPETDAALVARLRCAGAVIMGKTVSTEFALYHPGKTRNPHDVNRTPGGSSSGSAAAVADSMVPLAIGSQTNGSIIRPSAFCGVYGYKPTLGLVPRTGICMLSRALDCLGPMARSIDDLALIGEVIAGHDAGDPDTVPRARPPLQRLAASQPPAPPRLAFVQGPTWDRAEADTQNAFAALCDALADNVERVSLPDAFDDILESHRTLMIADVARNLSDLHQRSAAGMSESLRAIIEEGLGISAVTYHALRDHQATLYRHLQEVFRAFDAIVTPAAPGEAPVTRDSTGDPAFCSMWSFCGVPAINLPLLQGRNRMPMGIQMVGPRGGDAQLLRTGRWLEQRLREGASD